MYITQKLKARSSLRNLIDHVIVAIGIAYHYVTKKNLSASYLAMIRLHCVSAGKHTIQLSRLFGFISKSSHVSAHRSSMVKNLNDLEIKGICKEIEKNGFYIFDQLIAPEICDHLISVARTGNSNPDNSPNTNVKIQEIENQPTSKVYRMIEEDLVSDNIIQSLMGDRFFFEITKEYLKSTPILCSVKLWLSTTFKDPKDTSDKEAQIYHFDMSRARWLNYFLYLTDVDETAGPHCYVRGSNNIIPNSPEHDLLKRGYVRISDEDIEKSFGKNRIVEMKAKRGTLIIEDTRGFHKGKTPISKSRFMFEFVISNSLFGGYYRKVKLDTKNVSKALNDAILDSPKTFQVYDLQ